MSSGPTARGILAGLSVLELGRMVAAPYCGKLLADLGADVLKLERPGTGDPARKAGPFPDDVPHAERSALFLYLNTSKRGITLDPRGESGRDIFERLVAAADILIEDCDAAELEELELEPARLCALNPRLIVASITPFGRTGPYRDYRAHHLNLYHAAGQTSFSYSAAGESERPPPRAAGYLGEYDAGLTAALGAMAAVLRRTRSERGQHVDVSALEALMCLERVDIGRLSNTSNLPPWRGSVGGMLMTRDGYLMITPIQNHQWQGLVRAMGEPEWTREDWCRDELTRLENRERIQPYIEAWARELPRDEIYRRLQAEGSPAGPVRNVAEVRAWEQTEARGFFTEIAHPEAGAQVYPTAPYRLSGAEWPPGPAPLLGQHNHEVYCEWLGYSVGDLERLAAEGSI